jgi:hypothetical protein
MLKYEIPIQWMDGCSYLMNQRTFALLQSMSSADGRPLFGQMGTNTPGAGFSFAGFADQHRFSDGRLPARRNSGCLRQLEKGLYNRDQKAADAPGGSIFGRVPPLIQV